jgi:hypothetical protein
VLALAFILFVLPSILFYTALQMVRSLKTSHAGEVHHYAPQEQYHDFHDGETYEEIEMEPAPMVFPNLIMVPDDEDPEEMIPEEDEPAEQPNLEQQAPREDMEDHLDQEMEEEEQEQEQEEEAE